MDWRRCSSAGLEAVRRRGARTVLERVVSILGSLLLVVATLSCAPASPTSVAIAPDEAGLWEGTWLTADSSIEDNVYFMLSIDTPSVHSFTYELEDRYVPYGPNADWFSGSALFLDSTEAVDAEAERTFRLRVSPENPHERVIELDGESFLFQWKTAPGLGRGGFERGRAVAVGPRGVASVCERTPLVRDAVMAAVGVTDCEAITAADLAGIRSLDLRGSGNWLTYFYDTFGGEAPTVESRAPISFLDGDFAGLSTLETLWLSDNEPARLSERLFAGLSSLQLLDLSGNGLSTLPERVFTDLSGLRTLNLRLNRLETLPARVFAGLSNLEHLDLGNNSLETLPIGLFDGLAGLQSLDLGGETHNPMDGREGNFFSTLPEGLFAGLSSLASLDLGDNDLETLPTALFAGLSSLESLDLSGNNLASLPDGLFTGLSGLRELNLGVAPNVSGPSGGTDDMVGSGNNLTSLPSGVFAELSNLRTLDLSGNDLAALPEGVFAGLPCLESLDLSGNNLASLPEGVFDGLARLERPPYLEGNPSLSSGFLPQTELRRDARPCD